MSQPNVCIASCDGFLGQCILGYLATNCMGNLASLSCCYDTQHPETFTTWFENCEVFKNNPGARLGVSTISCDYSSKGQMSGCFSGMDCVVICIPESCDPKQAREWCDNAIAACESANVGQVLFMSCIGCEFADQWCKDPDWEACEEAWKGCDPAVLGCYFACERACRAAFPGCPILRCGFLQQWMSCWWETGVNNGVFDACWGGKGTGGMCPVNADDVAKCCAEILCCPSNTSGKWQCASKYMGCVYNLTGPKSYSATELAKCFAKNCPPLNGKCEYHPCTPNECRTRWNQFKPSPTAYGGGKWPCTEKCVAWCRMANLGECGWVSEDVAKICGTECVTVEEWMQKECN